MWNFDENFKIQRINRFTILATFPLVPLFYEVGFFLTELQSPCQERLTIHISSMCILIFCADQFFVELNSLSRSIFCAAYFFVQQNFDRNLDLFICTELMSVVTLKKARFNYFCTLHVHIICNPVQWYLPDGGISPYRTPVWGLCWGWDRGGCPCRCCRRPRPRWGDGRALPPPPKSGLRQPEGGEECNIWENKLKEWSWNSMKIHSFTLEEISEVINWNWSNTSRFVLPW